MCKHQKVVKGVAILCSLAFVSNVNAGLKQLDCDWTSKDSFFKERSTKSVAWGMVTWQSLLPYGMRIASAKSSLEELYNLKEHPLPSINEMNKQLIKSAENKLKNLQNKKESCESSDILLRYTFILNTDDLSTKDGALGEFSFKNCVADEHSNTVNTSVAIATPSVISFEEAGNTDDRFNIDRKTLKAGYGTYRDFQCKVKEVENNNKI